MSGHVDVMNILFEGLLSNLDGNNTVLNYRAYNCSLSFITMLK